MIKCPECGHQISDKAPVCPNCGVEIAGKIMKCPQCGEIYFKEQEMCPNCHHLTRLSGTVGNAGASASGQTADPVIDGSSTTPRFACCAGSCAAETSHSTDSSEVRRRQTTAEEEPHATGRGTDLCAHRLWSLLLFLQQRQDI